MWTKSARCAAVQTSEVAHELLKYLKKRCVFRAFFVYPFSALYNFVFTFSFKKPIYSLMIARAQKSIPQAQPEPNKKTSIYIS